MVMEVFVSKYIRGSVKIFSSGVKQTWVPMAGPVMWSRACYPDALSLGFIICKMGIMCPPRTDVERNEIKHILCTQQCLVYGKY